MAETALSAAALTRRAKAEAEQGNLGAARELLAEAITGNPGYAPAWLWFASVSRDDAERRFCLERAVALDPRSPAKATLARLSRVTPQAPAELEDLVDPPPPTLGGRANPRASATLRWSLVLLALLLLAPAVLAATRGRSAVGPTPVRVAVVAPLSGANPAGARQLADSVQRCVDRANQRGGIDGRPVVVDTYDDKGKPADAETVAREVVASDALFVVGPSLSSTAMAAGPVFAEGGIAAITPSATAPNVTADNPWLFRMTFDNVTEGRTIAAWTHAVLDATHLTIVHGTDVFGTTLAEGVAAGAAGTFEIRDEIAVPTDGDAAATEAGIAAAVAAVRAEPDPGPVVVALTSAPAKAFVAALREAGVTAPVVGGDAMGGNAFLSDLAALAPPGTDPAALTADLYAATPLISDSLGGEALRWSREYAAANGGTFPDWYGVTACDATIAGIAAARTALANGTGDLAAERTAVRDALAAMNSPATAVPGLLGPIRFQADRSVVRPVLFAEADGRDWVSAPVQYRPFTPSAMLDLPQALADGSVIRVGGELLQQQRVVFAGMNLNQVTDLDPKKRTFVADFFIWFRYSGSDDAVNVAFLNAIDPQLSLGDPVRTSKAGDVTYALYRLKAPFSARLDFLNFPFDEQQLPIVVANRTLPESQLVYAVDPHLRATSQAERLTSGTNASEPIDALPNWVAEELLFYQGTIGSTALLGDPAATPADLGLTYSTLTADLTVGRDLVTFLFNNLLPLVLLTLVTYVSLYLPPERAKSRVTMGITGMLTGAVLLKRLNATLPDVGYTVAIAWAYYAFIAICAMLVISGVFNQRLQKQRRLTAANRLTIATRLAYPILIIAVAVAYAISFG